MALRQSFSLPEQPNSQFSNHRKTTRNPIDRFFSTIRKDKKSELPDFDISFDAHTPDTIYWYDIQRDGTRMKGASKMHRTLFSPAMVEIFRSCRRAYEIANSKFSTGESGTASATCKRFILKGIAEINKSKIATVNQVQKYLGNWPVEELEKHFGEKELNTRAFLFAYKSLIRYATNPYRPDGAQVVAVGLKLRARVAHVRVYVEDTIDLVLWYPEQRKLEFVDFQTQPLKRLDPSWPTASMLFKQYLSERLQMRWAFDTLALTQYRITAGEFQMSSVNFDNTSTTRLHWDELVATLEEMKQPPTQEHRACSAATTQECKYCASLKPVLEVSEEGKLQLFYKTA
jgi:hypothetical protein